jgi:hypothetical protein
MRGVFPPKKGIKISTPGKPCPEVVKKLIQKLFR